MMAGEINRRLQQLQHNLTEERIARVAYKEFKSLTPVRSGNAKRNTRLKDNEIQANYAYATRLDNGWSSQAPNGMTEPTMKVVEDYIKKARKP
jgi:hypothetical protein